MPRGGKKTRIASFDGVEIRVMTRNEHCGPHVHAFHEGNGWELKIFFSFAGAEIVKVTLEAGRLPKQRVVQKCMDAVTDNLDECRKQFWEGVGLHCCLGNQYVTIDEHGCVRDATARTAGALLVQTASYVVSSGSLEFTVAGHAKRYTGICP